MISRNDKQLLRQIHRKKVREESGLFLIEGNKMVEEVLLLPSETPFRIEILAGTSAWIGDHLPRATNKPMRVEEVMVKELKGVSHMQAPQAVLALVRIPGVRNRIIPDDREFIMVLDDIQDPGNVGTILRICDWFGIESVVAGTGTSDFYSPKVVQASMGSVFRLQLHEKDLVPFIGELNPGTPVFGASIEGESIYETELPSRGILIMGNESKGIQPALKRLVTRSLTIPSFSKTHHAESLNVAVAAAIICSEFRRRASD